MASQVNIREKLDILQKTAPHICKYLIPTAVIPNLNTLLTQDKRRHILEIEEAGHREDAARLLLDVIISEGERGMNIFMDALREEGDDPGWPRILVPLENIDGDDVNESANEYYSFIIHLLEGQIIERLTDGVLEAVIVHLFSSGAIHDYEVDVIKATLANKGRYPACVLTFSLLGMRDHQWPVKFFCAVRKVKPDLYGKMAVFGVDPVVDKESREENTSEFATHDSPRSLEPEGAVSIDTSEHTLPKYQLEARETPEGPEPISVSHEEGDGAVREEEEEERRQASRRAPSSDDRQAPVSTPVADAETESSRFSDDEKQDTEGSEKCKGGKVRKMGPPKALALRQYQHELAQHALNGINTIICAPTGSGKTRVALHIVQKHLEGQAPGCRRKVVFLARTVPLVSQQHRNFREFLPDYQCELVTGESENSMTVHHLLDKNDILVLTPKILENHLTPDKISSLSAFSLIIFDECHHTRKGEPYNSVMKHYLKSKKRGETGLPQIVGLTASIGVEKATTPDEAKESILGIMGNLDVTVISEVVQHVKELMDTVPRPYEELATLESHENDDISNTISNVMLKIVEELLLREDWVKQDSELDDIRALLKKRETDLKSQKFAQWATNLRNQARLLLRPLGTPKNERELKKQMAREIFSWDVQVLADWLVDYNEGYHLLCSTPFFLRGLN